MIRIQLLIFICLLKAMCVAQQTTISIVDMDNKNIEYASFELNEVKGEIQTNNRIHVDEKSCLNGKLNIKIHHISYFLVDTTLICPLPKQIIIRLTERQNQLPQVLISLQKWKYYEYGILKIEGKQLRQSIGLFGTPDPIKLLQFTPGISTGLEGTNDVFLRGGRVDQTQLIFDNALILGQSHLFGLIAGINGHFIDDLKLYKGPIPVEFGAKASGFIHMTSLLPDSTDHLGFECGLISSSLWYRSKLINNKWYISGAGRMTYADKIIQFFNEVNTGFHDINLKMGMKLKDGVIELIYYQSKDEYRLMIGPFVSDINAQWFEWKNNNMVVNYDQNAKFKTHAHLSINLLNSTHADLDKLNSRNTKQYIIWSQYQLEKYLKDSTCLKIGLDNRLEFNTIIQNESFIHPDYLYAYNVLTPYMSLTKNIKRSSIVMGLRTNGICNFKEKSFQTYLEPRFALKTNNVYGSFILSFDRQIQYLQDLNTNFLSIPGSFWISSSKYLKPLISNTTSLTYDFSHFKNIQSSCGIFHKNYQHAFDFIDGAITSRLQSPHAQIAPVKAYAFGFEFYLKYVYKKNLTATIGYTYSRVFYQGNAEQINYGRTYPAFFDRPHIFNSGLMYMSHNKKIISQLNVVIQSNRPITAPISAGYIVIYSDRNAFRLPVYKRIDVSIKFIPKPTKSKWQSVWNFSLYNAFNFKNVFGIALNKDRQEFEYVVLFPIIPTLSYQLKIL